MKQERDALRALMINTVPMAYEGITTVMLNYAGNMRREGLRLDFLAINDVEESLRRAIADMDSRLFVIPGRNRHTARYIAALARLIRREGYDIVHAHGNSCTLAVDLLAARLGGAGVRIAHSHNTTTGSMAIHRLLRGPFEWNCTHRMACGEAAGRWLFHEKPFVLLNNGIRPDRFAFDPEARRKWRAALGLGDRTAIGCVANFQPRKNHAFLIDVFHRVVARRPDCALVLMGDGPERPAIESKAAALGLGDRVIFTGTTREVPGLLSAMDLMALPSLFEGLPNVLIEWQASGLRALVSDRVTEACRLTPLVDFLPLEEDRWVDAVLRWAPGDRAGASAAAAEAIARAGYDIRLSADHLRRMYFEFAGRTLPGGEV